LEASEKHNQPAILYGYTGRGSAKADRGHTVLAKRYLKVQQSKMLWESPAAQGWAEQGSSNIAGKES
jgi:hypothetical protein